MRSEIGLFAMGLVLLLGGCAVVDAGADVVGAAGNLAGATAHATAGVIHSAANAGRGSRKAKDCSGGGDNTPDCQ
jgi:hypothetical protein